MRFVLFCMRGPLSSPCLALIITLVFGVALAQPQGSLAPTPCPFRVSENLQQELTCFTLYVPESHSAVTGSTLELAVARLKSLADTPEPDPIIYLEGGPGGAAIVGLEPWLDSPLREHREIILIDQRGTGYSKPSLNCDDLSDDETYLDSVRACFLQLTQQGIQLSTYNSAESAADIAMLRQALGVEQINLYGVSYGTRLALTLMRDHPTMLRSVVLDSVYPPHVNGIAESPKYGVRAFEQLFTDCVNSIACAAAYPNLRERFSSAVITLNQEEEGAGNALLETFFSGFYDTFLLPYIPLIMEFVIDEELDTAYAILDGDLHPIDALEAGGIASFFTGVAETIVDWFVRPVHTIDDDAEGVYNSIECFEDASFQQPEDVLQESKDLPIPYKTAFVDTALLQLKECGIWQSGAAPALENEPVLSDVPTLLLAGDYDPVTPPAWAQSAAQYLSKGQYVEFHGVGHGVIDGGPCALSIISAFISNPTQAVDTTCQADEGFEFFIP